MEDIKKQIQELISASKTEEALRILKEHTNDALLLLARYNNAKKQQMLGIIDFSDWSRQIAQINFAALELVSSLGDAPSRASSTTPTHNDNGTGNATKSVFITYSPEVEEDKVAALRMRDYLGQHRLSVSSNDDMPINTNIQQYVNEKLKESDYVIVVLSKRALVDSWESGEAALSIVLERASENKVIPVSLDNGVVDPDFFFESLDNLNEKIKKYQGYMKRAIDMGEDSRAFQADLNRLISAKNQLPQIIEKIKSTRMVDMKNAEGISDETFNKSMEKILHKIYNPSN